MWIREGECNHCGQCCVGQYETGTVDPAVNGGYCTAFRWERPGYGHCTLHSAMSGYYAQGCNVWPTHPQQIADKPLCSYTFRWLP